MPSPHPRSISGFLATARKALTAPKSSRPTPLTLVIGNEAADLDSFCSAFLYAYLRSHTPPHYTLHLPLVNVPRPDLALRKDVDGAFAAAGLTRSDLLSLSEIPDDLGAEETRWVLVDHNELTGDLARRFGGGRVVGCVDHHADEGAVPADTGDEPRVIRPCGSCATLVVEYCRQTWDAVVVEAAAAEEGSGEKEVAAQLGRIALGPILADTQVLKSRSKTTDADREVAALVEPLVRDADPTYDREGYFAELMRLKEDIDGFSYRDVLRKDYKEWTAPASTSDGAGGVERRLGMSSVPHDFASLLERVGPREELLGETRTWAEERRLDVVSIMTVRTADDGVGLKRELLVWALNPDAVPAARAFRDRFGDELELERWGDGSLDGGDDGAAGHRGRVGDVEGVVDVKRDGGGGAGEWRMCWAQGNQEHSRKQVAPMLRQAMKEASKL